MIAKFRSAPGHSMETTLTINLPPRQSVRTGGASDQLQLKKEPKDKSISKKGGDHKQAHNVSYKDKFQKMREKYDKVTLTHENHNRDLEILNSKIKKLQAENDLLLDSIDVSEPDLLTRYFPAPSSPTHRGQPLPPAQAGHYPSTMPPPPPPISAVSSSATGTTTTSQQQPSMPPPFSPMQMAPPMSATSNGTTNSSTTARAPNSHSHSSSRRQSTESSSQGGRVPTERRRRSDAHGHGGGPASAPRTPTQVHRSGSGMMNDERGMRSPRTNGASAQPRSPMAAMPIGPGGGTPMNGLRSPQTHRRQSDVAPQPPMMLSHEDDIMAERERQRERERERDNGDGDTYRHEPPPMNDDGAYNAYATVNSPDEDEEEDNNERVKMDMDV
ncbi:hypothetical protein D9619_006750 [Psilocybe cf. subviscida]|uniref:Uncharacterized protein n=1 Tax=Psilocybe cf. subviscida TaxID=2480587 RepID=A0A8H5B400_9AGAR|nr:hypothetical protein D9619_006750 [Psilocybe cf. subviscida]